MLIPDIVTLNNIALVFTGLSVSFITLTLFRFLDTLVAEYKRKALPRIILAVINGTLATLILLFYKTGVPTVLLILIITFLFAEEYKHFSKDTFLVYVFFGSSIYFNYLTIYLMCYSMYRILPLDVFDITGKIFQRMVIIVTNLCCLACFAFFKSKVFLGKEVKEIIHSSERMLLNIWLPVANVFLTAFALIMLPMIQNENMTRLYEISLYLAVFLWAICCFSSVYIIILYQAYQVRKKNEMRDALIQEKEQKARLKEQADRHPLTGLLNRRAWERKVKKVLSSGAKGYMIMMDLDHFKDVNDNLGHQEGDNVLKETAEILRQTFRSVDIIGHIGGDEFCVFVVGNFGKEIVEQRLEQVSNMRRKEFPKKSGGTFCLSLSAGYSKVPVNGKMPDMFIELIAEADSALYWQKEHGRNGYVMFRDDMKIKTH